jgi:hypothetical protein
VVAVSRRFSTSCVPGVSRARQRAEAAPAEGTDAALYSTWSSSTASKQAELVLPGEQFDDGAETPEQRHDDERLEPERDCADDVRLGVEVVLTPDGAEHQADDA